MKNLLFIILASLVMACSKDSPEPNQSQNPPASTVADTVWITGICTSCHTVPSYLSVTLSGVLNLSTSQWGSGSTKFYLNVPYGTIYWTGYKTSTTTGQFQVTATAKRFTVTAS